MDESLFTKENITDSWTHSFSSHTPSTHLEQGCSRGLENTRDSDDDPRLCRLLSAFHQQRLSKVLTGHHLALYDSDISSDVCVFFHAVKQVTQVWRCLPRSKSQIPWVKGSIPQDCLMPLLEMPVTSPAVTGASDQPAPDQRFPGPPFWVWLIS